MTAIKAPYPSDLAAKGWHLDLDYERIQQSDTWALATADQRPWLLMLWLTSWHQVPVASLPANHKLIAARIGMPLAQFEQWADVLLSGWQQADDGRLYHSTLTEIVLKMVDKRLKEKARIAKYRASISSENVTRDERVSNDDVTRYTHVTTPLVTHEYTRSTTPSPSPTPTDKEKEKTHLSETAAKPTEIPQDKPAESVKKFPGFVRWYESYPKKENKSGALKAWVKHKCESMADEVISATQRVVSIKGWSAKDQFTPLPSSFLNARRWEDEPVPIYADRGSQGLSVAERNAALLAQVSSGMVGNTIESDARWVE